MRVDNLLSLMRGSFIHLCTCPVRTLQAKFGKA